MPTFVYKAITENGQIVKNTISDTNKEKCLARLKQSGLTPISIKKSNNNIFGEQPKNLSTLRYKIQIRHSFK